MLAGNLMIELQEYVKSHTEREITTSKMVDYPAKLERCYSYDKVETYTEPGLYEGIAHHVKETRQPSFREVLFRFIDKKGIPDTEVYKNAGIDRRHFSKIRTNEEYKPGKLTVIALILALELNEEEAKELLHSAGHSLSRSILFDLIVYFFLEKKIYDIDAVNYALDDFGIKTLLGVKE